MEILIKSNAVLPILDPECILKDLRVLRKKVKIEIEYMVWNMSIK